jgi:hypothetical protein
LQDSVNVLVWLQTIVCNVKEAKTKNSVTLRNPRQKNLAYLAKKIDALRHPQALLPWPRTGDPFLIRV